MMSIRQDSVQFGIKTVPSMLYLIVRLVAIPVGLILFACFLINTVITFIGMKHRADVAVYDDSQRFLSNLGEILGDDWQLSNVSLGFEDIRGIDDSIAGTAYVRINPANGLGWINYKVIAYVNSSDARARYFVQEQWVFDYDFGVPPSVQIFSYHDVNLPSMLQLNADEYRVGCKDITQAGEIIESRCGGLFLYGNHVVFVDSFAVRNSVRYLSLDSLAVIFEAMDRQFLEA